MKNLLLLLAILSLAGCSTTTVQELSDQARARDNNPNEYSYKDGAAAGCSSGGNATGNWTKSFQKDVKKYINDQYYKSGWDDGFAQCKAQGEQVNGVIRDSIR